MIHKKTLPSSILIVEDNEVDFIVESYLANEGNLVIVRKENNLLLNNNYDKR